MLPRLESFESMPFPGNSQQDVKYVNPYNLNVVNTANTLPIPYAYQYNINHIGLGKVFRLMMLLFYENSIFLNQGTDLEHFFKIDESGRGSKKL